MGARVLLMGFIAAW